MTISATNSYVEVGDGCTNYYNTIGQPLPMFHIDYHLVSNNGSVPECDDVVITMICIIGVLSFFVFLIFQPVLLSLFVSMAFLGTMSVMWLFGRDYIAIGEAGMRYHSLPDYVVEYGLGKSEYTSERVIGGKRCFFYDHNEFIQKTDPWLSLNPEEQNTFLNGVNRKGRIINEDDDYDDY